MSGEIDYIWIINALLNLENGITYSEKALSKHL